MGFYWKDKKDQVRVASPFMSGNDDHSCPKSCSLAVVISPIKLTIHGQRSRWTYGNRLRFLLRLILLDFWYPPSHSWCTSVKLACISTTSD